MPNIPKLFMTLSRFGAVVNRAWRKRKGCCGLLAAGFHGGRAGPDCLPFPYSFRARHRLLPIACLEMFCLCVIAICGFLFALPIDPLPEFIPIIGGVDAVGYVMIAGSCFLVMMRQKTKRQDLKFML